MSSPSTSPAARPTRGLPFADQPRAEQSRKTYVEPTAEDLATRVTEGSRRLQEELRISAVSMQDINRSFTSTTELENNKYELSLEESFQLSSSIQEFEKKCSERFDRSNLLHQTYVEIQQDCDQLSRLNPTRAATLALQLNEIGRELFELQACAGTARKRLAEELNHHLIAFIKLTDRETRKLCDYWHKNTDTVLELWITATWLKTQLEEIQMLREKNCNLGTTIKGPLDTKLKQQTTDVTSAENLIRSLDILIANAETLATAKELELELPKKTISHSEITHFIEQVQTGINEKKIAASLQSLKVLWAETQKKEENLANIESPKALKELMKAPQKILQELQSLKDFIWKQKLRLVHKMKYLDTLQLDQRKISEITQRLSQLSRQLEQFENDPLLKTTEKSFTQLDNAIYVNVRALVKDQVDKQKSAWETLSNELKKQKYKEHLENAKILKSAISETLDYFMGLGEYVNSSLLDLRIGMESLATEIKEFAYDNDLQLEGENPPVLQRGAQIFTNGITAAFQGAGIGACLKAGASWWHGTGYDISAALGSASFGAAAGFFVGNKPYYNWKFWKGYNWNQAIRMAGISVTAGLALQGLSANLLTTIPKQNHDVAAWSAGVIGIIPTVSLACDTIQGIYNSFTSCCHSSKKEEVLPSAKETTYEDPRALLKKTKTEQPKKAAARPSAEEEGEQTATIHTTWGKWVKSPFYWARRTLKTNPVPRLVVGLTALCATGIAIKNVKNCLEKGDWAAIPTGVIGNMLLGAGASAVSAWQWRDPINKLQNAVRSTVLQNRVIQAFSKTTNREELVTTQSTDEEPETLHEPAVHERTNQRFKTAAKRVANQNKNEK